MPTLHAQVSTKSKAPDSGGQEGGAVGEIFGAPASWEFRDMVRISIATVSRNPRLVAGLAGIAALGVGADVLLGGPRIVQRVVGFPVGVLAMGATYMTVVEGREGLTLEEVSSRFLKKVPAALGTPLLLCFYSLVATLILALGCGAVYLAGFSALAKVLAAVGFLGILVVTSVHGQLLAHEVVLGETSGNEAISRSYALTKNQLGAVFLPAFGIAFLMQMVIVFGVIAALIPGFVMVATTPEAAHPMLGLLAGTVGVFFGSVVGIWACAGYVTVYLRARDRA